MNQQVNLFQPGLRARRGPLRAKTMLVCCLVAVAGLAGIYGYGAWQLSALSAEVASLERHRDDAVARLTRLDSQLPRREPSRRLRAEVEILERQIRDHRALGGALRARMDANRSGFSSFLEGLSRQTVSGLWLTGLKVSDGGKDIVIHGSALKADLVPALVRKLSAEKSFAGRKFRMLEVVRPATGDDRVDFTLRTFAEEGERT